MGFILIFFDFSAINLSTNLFEELIGRQQNVSMLLLYGFSKFFSH